MFHINCLENKYMYRLGVYFCFCLFLIGCLVESLLLNMDPKLVKNDIILYCKSRGLSENECLYFQIWS